MIADDFPDMVKAVSRVLAQDCDVVGTVADGSALLDAAERLQPDVILLDLSLANANVLRPAVRSRELIPRHESLYSRA